MTSKQRNAYNHYTRGIQKKAKWLILICIQKKVMFNILNFKKIIWHIFQVRIVFKLAQIPDYGPSGILGSDRKQNNT